MSEKRTIQVIDRMSSLLDAVARYPEPVSLNGAFLRHNGFTL